jgi:putative sporulation protein YyaC
LEEEEFKQYMKTLKSGLDVDSEVIFFCIGTDRVIGDSLGPIIGSLLIDRYGKDRVCGDLYNNVTYKNIEEKINTIKNKRKNAYIIAVDAALSTDQNIGKIFVDEGINFGNSLGKNLTKVGDVGVKVVVGKDYNDPKLNFRCLQNIPLSKILQLSKKTFEGISLIMNN